MKRIKRLFPFKYFFKQEETPHNMNLYFEHTLDSKNNNMSRGAQYVNRIISWARGDNWRRGREKKK